jgi:hypothetical protein
LCTNRASVSKYGSIPDLPDEELADPEELERQVFIKEWGPILELPVRGAPTIKPNIDENGCADWGAFHTWDFERVSPKFDKVGYKLDRLREELHDAGIMISIIRRHVPRDKMNKTLELVGIGHLATADIADEDLRGLARFHLRARRILKEIERIQAQRRRRKEREVAAMLARWE